MASKLVFIASMSMLGLISYPVWAETETRHQMGNLVVVNPTPPTCPINQSFVLMKEMTQNAGRAFANCCSPGWYHRIGLAGGVNVDLGKFGNRNANFMGENYQRASINDAYLNITTSVNDWVVVFGSLSYNNATINDPRASTITSHVAEFDTAYSNNITNGSSNNFELEQAFITMANFDRSPIFVQLGQQFQDYGRYELHPITEDMTQVMTKILATSAKVGFLFNGFTGSAYAFYDPFAKVNHKSINTNYGLSLGYSYQGSPCIAGWDLGIGYIYNLIGVNDIGYNVNQFNLNNPLNLPGGGYNQNTSGIALYADVTPGPFSLSARYTVSTERFNNADLPKNGIADLLPTGIPKANIQGAKPWAASIRGGYGFGWWGIPQNIYLGYQASRQAAGLLLPKNRWLAGYGIEVWRHSKFDIEWDRDLDYSTGNGGTSKNTNLVTLRAAVKFS